MGNRKAPTPVDSNQVKPAPPPAPPRKYACLFPICVAFAVDGRDHCPVHSPEKVLERAKAIVRKRIDEAAILSFSELDLPDLLKTILRDLDATV